ncbi:MASE1 domain-containing protein [Stenotrophomonas sp. AB1(2024)]|uniref:MASE1 domain-containing protein n=1 Tax=Stenotrophomonas sp. AB1(2024) TaxID=3132215 RepID=UPI0038FABBDF
MLKKGLQLKFQVRIEGLALATAYALTCWATRQVSVDQFYLTAGVRVAALLLCPPRLWPYLILGEYAYLAHSVYPMIDRYGVAWAVLRSALLMPVAALIVRLHITHVTLTSAGWLVSLAAFTSLSLTAINITMAQLLWPTPPSIPAIERMVRYSLGDFVGIMTVAPLALLWIRRTSGSMWPFPHPVSTMASVASILALGLFAYWIPQEHSSFQTTLQLSMALPAISLTCLHGWRGAAVGVPLLNLIVHFATPVSGLPGSFDAATFKTQQSLAVVSTSLFALGTIASHYRHRFRVSQQDRSEALVLAKASQLASERELRTRVLRMRQIGENIDFSLSQMIDWLNGQGHRQFASAVLKASTVSSQQLREQTSMVYPTALEHVGLYLALQIGGISQEWEATERVGRPHLSGDPCELSTGLQLAAYRTIADAVSLLLEQEKGQVQVRARCGGAGGLQGIVITVGLLDAGHVLSAKTIQAATERLTSRTLTYGGKLQCCGNRVRLLLVEAPKGVAAEPLAAPSTRRKLQRQVSPS